MKRVLAIVLLLWATPVFAADISFQPGTTQQMFKDFTKDIGGILLYRAVEPAAPLGLTGFNIGVEATATQIHNEKDYMKNAFKDRNPPSYLVVPRLHVQKGLPFGFDVGLVYSRIPDTDIQYAGGEVKYAVFKGGVLWPAIAVRGSYTQVFGVDQLDFKTYGVEITASKGFGVGIKIIPYVALGEYWAEGKAKNLPAGLNFSKETVAMTRGAIGAKLQVGIFALTGEVDYVQAPSYTLRAGIAW